MLRHVSPRGSLTLLVILLLAAGGCGEKSSASAPAAIPRVTVAHPVVRELVDEDDYNGWLQASETVEVRSRVRGHIQKVAFQDGDLVQAGRLLFELDPRPFQVAIDEAKAQAKALDAQRVAAEKNVARYRELLRSRAVSEQEYEKVLADADSYAAQIAAKQQEVVRFQLDLEFSRITAPISGRIDRAQLTVGNLVNAGGSDPLLATIVAVNPIYVYFTIDERALQRYQKRQSTDKGELPPTSVRQQKIPFRFGLDTEQGFPHEGVLDFADNRVDSATGTIEVRGVVDNRQQQFIPGSRVRVRVPVSNKYQALLVPDSALLTDQDRKYLLVLGKDNVVLRRDVLLGKLLDDGQRVIRGAVTAGEDLGPNDWVITLGLQRARVNYPVAPLDAQGQPIASLANPQPSG